MHRIVVPGSLENTVFVVTHGREWTVESNHQSLSTGLLRTTQLITLLSTGGGGGVSSGALLGLWVNSLKSEWMSKVGHITELSPHKFSTRMVASFPSCSRCPPVTRVVLKSIVLRGVIIFMVSVWCCYFISPFFFFRGGCLPACWPYQANQYNWQRLQLATITTVLLVAVELFLILFYWCWSRKTTTIIRGG